MNRFHPYQKPTQRIDAQYQAETRTFERMAEVNGDTATAGASKAQSGELTTMSDLQAAERSKLSDGGVKRDKHGFIYPPADFSFPPGDQKLVP